MPIMCRVAGQSSREAQRTMTLKAHLATLDQLPAVVARLTAIGVAAKALADVHYAGADALTYELNLALESLDGTPGALLYLAGLNHAGGDAARFERWDAGVAARMRVGDL
jgi:hypothetical protein